MKSLVIFCCLSCIAIYQAVAQGSGKVKIGAGADLARELAIEVKYRFPQFKKGEIVYISGQSANALFNYNILLNEMHYIDQKGDTLALDQEQLIKHISIDGKTFYYDQQRGYQELIADYKDLKLTYYQHLRTTNREKIGAYGQVTSISSIRSYGTINNGESSYYKLNSNDIVTLKKEITFFLIDKNNRFIATTKSNILKLFPHYKKEIEKYLQETAIDFNKEEDLKKLLQFCSQMS